MGAILRVRVHYVDLPHRLAQAAAAGIPVYGTFLEGENIYESQLTPDGILVMGNEGRGIGPDAARAVNRKLLIPPYPAVPGSCQPVTRRGDPLGAPSGSAAAGGIRHAGAGFAGRSAPFG